MTAICVEGNKVVEHEYIEEPWRDGVARHKVPGPGRLIDTCANEADARLVYDRITQGSSPTFH